MEIFVFSSESLTNIWAGIGARLWAVASTDDVSSAASRKTKSQKMSVGSFGILYCNATHSLTTPFVVYSKPDLDQRITNVWPEPNGWVLPFRIFPLGTPDRQLVKDRAKAILPIFKRTGKNNFGHVFSVQAVTVFSPTKIESDDWEILISELASRN